MIPRSTFGKAFGRIRIEWNGMIFSFKTAHGTFLEDAHMPLNYFTVPFYMLPQRLT